MTSPLTTRLSEIESRLKAATPGPWEHLTLPCECGDCENEAEPSCTAGYITGKDGESLYTVDCGDHHALSHKDCALIAAAPTDTAFLLEALRVAMEGLTMAYKSSNSDGHLEKTFANLERLAAGKVEA